MGRCERGAAPTATGGDVVGDHIIDVTRQNAIKRGMDVRTNAKALKILETLGGAVSGVLVQNKPGQLTRSRRRR